MFYGSPHFIILRLVKARYVKGNVNCTILKPPTGASDRGRWAASQGEKQGGSREKLKINYHDKREELLYYIWKTITNTKLETGACKTIFLGSLSRALANHVNDFGHILPEVIGVVYWSACFSFWLNKNNARYI